MSGFNPKTGWCHFTPMKWGKYFREIEGQSEHIEARFVQRNIPFYWDRAKGLHAKCTDGQMWEILSGRESTWSSAMPDENLLEPEYLVVTDLGCNLKPALSPIKTNRLLKEFDYQEKLEGVWKPTETGKDFCLVCQGQGGRYGSETYLKWRFEMIHLLMQAISTRQRVEAAKHLPPAQDLH